MNKLLPESAVDPKSEESAVVNSEHKGRIIYRQNDMYQDVPFEPHQCGIACVDEFPYAEDSFKSNHKSFFSFFSLNVKFTVN